MSSELPFDLDFRGRKCILLINKDNFEGDIHFRPVLGLNFKGFSPCDFRGITYENKNSPWETRTSLMLKEKSDQGEKRPKIEKVSQAYFVSLR